MTALILSLIIFLMALSHMAFSNVLRRRKSTGVGKTVIFSGLVFLSVLCVVFAVNALKTSPSFKLFCLSVLDVLQVFSLDASYSEIVDGVQELLINSNNTFMSAFFSKIYVPLILVVAPVTGGAILLEILVNIFPKIRAALVKVCFWCEIIYISELNENSLSFAKSVCESKKYTFINRPIIIFTSVNTDNENEQTYEQQLTAKALGAICLKDDILHIKMRRWFKKRIFLIDDKQESNLQTLSMLTDIEYYGINYLKNTEIYIFSEHSISDFMIQIITDNLREAVAKKDKYLPSVHLINTNKSIIRNLFKEISLGEPLKGKADALSATEKCDLNITLIGCGKHGLEAFLSSYGMGERLNCNLNISVISKEEPREFENRLDSVNTDMMRCYEEGENSADSYFNYKYIRADIINDNNKNTAKEYYKTLISSSYIVIMLGSDEDNLVAAEKIKRIIKTAQTDTTDNREINGQERTVIAYAVYNPDLCAALNARDNDTAAAMYAFGSTDMTYSMDNIYSESRGDEFDTIYDSDEKQL